VSSRCGRSRHSHPRFRRQNRGRSHHDRPSLTRDGGTTFHFVTMASTKRSHAPVMLPRVKTCGSAAASPRSGSTWKRARGRDPSRHRAGPARNRRELAHGAFTRARALRVPVSMWRLCVPQLVPHVIEAERRLESRSLLAVAFAMAAARPAARPTLAFLQLLLRSPDATLSGHLLLGILNPADELVAGQGRDVPPCIERRRVRKQRIA
jgi:hypothetical protein